jgi:hypothetical protein
MMLWNPNNLDADLDDAFAPTYHLRQVAIERANRVPGVRLVTDESK